MFKKFVAEEQVSGSTQVKSSVARAIKSKAVEMMPPIEHIIDELCPKKAAFHEVKCKDHIKIYAVNEELLFFQQRDGPIIPTLRLLHKYPNLLPRMQVDKGAIKFVLSGANVMCPGLTSEGGSMEDVPADTIVALFAEGKQHAMAIGVTKMSTEEIRAVNRDIGIDSIHCLGDGLWAMDPASLNLK
mmetsp:Transcript_9419/g.24288  ORF Transcript_9419/g.24288 Transcript_9419/m.24288 type:complete len:186 (+) Transcript_9419:120-677(+)|eukprot:CAMPEP_0182921580 /NCGR_PEP_ID=MMETSP0105_2-20130417/4232_1 /TAXON_ID=81532 ORGANISM="Acanthoeca-like sp., Strain 10tr" /NCGR_SAMPLE_ID=MMETSP0105_2 /ASSEMBLY_ACC=CAM_ASM_000205 /LENGTH=185 /DNA_ID=CAMNT_0025059111 /DNA_START=106 /DNA_END=663 /DNA_ORIENTATION=+